MTKCKICGKNLKIITNTHLVSTHGWSLCDCIRKFGPKNCGFIRPNLLPKSDVRYKKWKESLKKRPPPWSKGHTKKTHPGVAKISATFKKRKIDNFSAWRQKMIRQGKWHYPPLPQNADTAELIGVILGDGHIAKFPRTESLTIASNSNNHGFISRYSRMIEKLFHKTPYIKRTGKLTNCVRIRIYQKQIGKRLKIPTGDRSRSKIKIPKWIWQNEKFLVRFLRGLYEAEGSFCVHKPTGTYKFIFSNKNKSLLEIVQRALETLGFHPHESCYKIQISRRNETYRAKNLLHFRDYN